MQELVRDKFAFANGVSMSAWLGRGLLHKFKKTMFRATHGRYFREFPRSSTIIDHLTVQGHRFISIGPSVYIHKYVWLGAYELNPGDQPELTIGENCCLGNFNHITAVRKVILGRKVLTADRVHISDSSHDYSNPRFPIVEQKLRFTREVIIGEGAWLGENVCVLGANVGRNSVVGANSVVTRDIPDFCVAVGAPARVIKKYNFENESWESVTGP